MKRVWLLLFFMALPMAEALGQERDTTSTKDELKEVVVIGYGSVSKRDVTGSVQALSAADLRSSNSPEFERSMQGALSGVYIQPTTGSPGSSYDINIRGRGSINAGVQPLFIVDGVVFSNASRSSMGIKDANMMGGMNQDDIASISVIKDGATASIYGAQASNGIIIITTKRGFEGKTRISLNMSVGAQKLAHKVSLMNGPEWAEYTLSEYKNYNPQMGASRLKSYQDYGWGVDGFSSAPTTSWYKEIYRTSLTQNYEASISGGNSKTKFYISGNYNKTAGIIRNTDFSRGTVRLNLSHEAAKYLTVNSLTTFSRDIYNQPTYSSDYANPAKGAEFTIPAFSPRDERGEYVKKNPLGGVYGYNTLQILELNENYAKNSNLISSNSLDFKLLDGLKFSSSYVVGYTWVNEHQFIDPRTALGERMSGMAASFAIDITKFQTDQVLTYTKALGESVLTATAGFSYIDSKTHLTGGSAMGLSSPDLHLLSAASTPLAAVETYSQWKMAGFFGRVNFSFKDKYIIAATLRYDGSSKFGDNNLWGWFPSIAAAWRINDNLKLRAGYGVTGNSDIGAYTAHRLYEGGHSYLGEAGVIASSIGNSKLTWEKKHSRNVGLSADFFSRRVSVDLDFYSDKTKDLLYDRIIPSTTQFTSIPSNMGGIKNQGFEFQIKTENFASADFRWETNFNIAFAHNKITSLQEGASQMGSFKAGKPMTATRMYKYAGVDPATGGPLYYDKNGAVTPHPSPADCYWSKGEEPKIFGGFSNTITWKNFSLFFLCQFQAGAEVLWSDKAVLMGQTGNTNLLKSLYNNPKMPKAVYNGMYEGNPLKYNTIGDISSSLLYESTNFFKLKNISLSYLLPYRIVKKAGLERAELYLNAYNPERSGDYQGMYPGAKSITIGVRITL